MLFQVLVSTCQAKIGTVELPKAVQNTKKGTKRTRAAQVTGANAEGGGEELEDVRYGITVQMRKLFNSKNVSEDTLQAQAKLLSSKWQKKVIMFEYSSNFVVLLHKVKAYAIIWLGGPQRMTLKRGMLLVRKMVVYTKANATKWKEEHSLGVGEYGATFVHLVEAKAADGQSVGEYVDVLFTSLSLVDGGKPLWHCGNHSPKGSKACNTELNAKMRENEDVYITWEVLSDIEPGREVCYDYGDGKASEAFVLLYDEYDEVHNHEDWGKVLESRVNTSQGGEMSRIPAPEGFGESFQKQEDGMVTLRGDMRLKQETREGSHKAAKDVEQARGEVQSCLTKLANAEKDLAKKENAERNQPSVEPEEVIQATLQLSKQTTEYEANVKRSREKVSTPCVCALLSLELKMVFVCRY